MNFSVVDGSMRGVLALNSHAGYPVLEVRGKSLATGEERLIGPCTFHSIAKRGTDRTDFTGMGLTIIGNMVRGLKSGEIDRDWVYRISFILAPGAKPVILPWPGMDTDAPLPLDLDKLPFDYSMFLDPVTKWANRYVDRMKLFDRIGKVWTPFVVKAMRKEGSADGVD